MSLRIAASGRFHNNQFLPIRSQKLRVNLAPGRRQSIFPPVH